MAASQLRDQVQKSLGAIYTIERELGGGGMSRVFVAEEIALGRKVVIKILPSELSQGLSADRFAREIRLAARLQHPHIVPLFSAGSIDGLPYYTMPFIEGESQPHRAYPAFVDGARSDERWKARRCDITLPPGHR